MLNPLARLRDARASNPSGATVPVFAGDVQDVCAPLDPKAPPVAALVELALPVERPGAQIRVPGAHLDKVIELASKKAN
ncbi:unnamed protein product [Gemmata massiliana]|uniref:Uncharacterized protein n=1 Tax=Gemmata massiliana TaxID=1210884 RepID=A0A6P2DGX4_9BACT|nr:hypothetical protein [Gemmata massiliana]VTS01577.1 unnamed protein product [Gemmata massiliana]